MSITASVVGGIIQVGDETNPDFSITLTADAGVITQSVRQTLTGLVGASATTLNEPASGGRIVKAAFFWIKGKDASGDPKKFKLTLNGVIIPELTEALFVSKTPVTGFTAAIVTNDVGSSALLDIEYAVAG